MAKARSGLGRGLGSLLGSGVDGTLPQEQSTPVERVKVESGEDNQTPKKPSSFPKTPVMPARPAVSVDPVEEKKDEPAVVEEAVEDKAEETASVPQEVYTNKEDNITIKSVTERTVDSQSRRPEVQRRVNTVEVRENDVTEIAIDLVEPNPNQPRTNFKKEELEELAASIKKNGLLQPILVRKKGDKYEIIAGERRYQACKSLGMEKVPVNVRDTDDADMVMLALVENIQRSDLNPIEEAYGYRRMMERGKMTQSEVAQAVSKGRSTIANALRLLELPEEAQQLLYEEKITAGHARAILSIPDKEGRKKLTDKLIKDQISVREAEAIARLLSAKNDKKPVERKQVPKSYKTAARSLSETLKTGVKIKSVKGKNKIEIEFKDETDLERLFRIMTNPTK